MNSKRMLRGAVLLGLAGGLLAQFPTVALAAETPAFTLTDSRVADATGLAADPATKTYWTVVKKGASASAYAVGPNGKVAGTLNFQVAPVDVEAVAMTGGRLYIADIGDANRQRASVTVYYFDNPKTAKGTVSYRSWDFRYADGAHDAKAVAVNASGRIFVVTAGKKSRIYAAPKKLTVAGTNELKKVGNAPGSVTDAVFLPDGNLALLADGKSVELMDPKTWTSNASQPISSSGLKARSLTLGLDGQSLLVAGSGKKAKVVSMPFPTPGAAPTPGASASEPADNSDELSDDPADSASTGGNLVRNVALGLAGVVAVASGAIVALVRRGA